MISKHDHTHNNNTERLKENYDNQQDKKKNNIKRQQQTDIQYLCSQEKCTLKLKKIECNVLLTIYFVGNQGHIIYKRKNPKKQSYSINCNSILNLLQDDAKKTKVILTFNQEINYFENQKGDSLDIKFINQNIAIRCKQKLLSLIKSNKYEVKQRVTQKAQYKNVEKIAQDIPLQKKQMTKQYQQQIKSNNRNISIQQKDQKYKIQKTKEISVNSSQDLYIKMKQAENQLQKTRKELQNQREENKRMCLSKTMMIEKDQAIRSLNEKIGNLQQDLNKKESKYNQKVRQLLQKIEKIGQVLKYEQQKNNRLIAILDEKEKQLQIKQNKIKTNKSIDELNKLRQKNQIEIANLEGKLLKKYEEQTKKAKLQIQKVENRKYKEMQNNYLQIKNNYLRLQQKYNSLQKDYNQMNYLHIFEGPVLQKYIKQKSFLKESIEKYTRRKILKTTLIYKFDKKSNTNFHHYIDGNQNFVVIAKTANAMYFAAFSQSCVKPKQIANKGGLILSLTNQRVFELIKNMRSVSYDDFYIIFGNSQIRIKCQENKVFSNFGSSNGCYNAQGESINILLGQGTLRQTQLDNYEFHKIIFQN